MGDFGNEKSSVLIIDDEEQVRNLLNDVLRVENQCTAVGSAEEALELLDTQDFDLDQRHKHGWDLQTS